MAETRDIPFPIGEYRTRLTGVQERMQARDIDLLLAYTPENINYLTGYNTTGYYVYQCLLVPADRDPIMVTRELEKDNVTMGTWLEDYRIFGDSEDPVATTCEAIKEFGYGEKRIGFESTSWFLQLRDYQQTVSLLPRADVKDGGNIVEESRVIKSPLEIECIREAARIVAKGMQSGIEAARPGVTDNYVAGELTRTLYAEGSIYFAGQPYVASGKRTGRGHITFANVTLEPGDPVFFEISANVSRYSASLMRTISLGPPDDMVKSVAEASIAGLTAAVENMGPGMTSHDADAFCRNAITKAGYGELFNHRTGYSIGVGYPPGWGEGHIMDIKPGDQRELKPGMTFHLTPAILIPGVAGPGFSETVLITDDGAEVLTSFPREFLVKEV